MYMYIYTYIGFENPYQLPWTRKRLFRTVAQQRQVFIYLLERMGTFRRIQQSISSNLFVCKGTNFFGVVPT